MKTKVLAPIVYGIMWASSYTTALSQLSQLTLDEYPVYIVLEYKDNPIADKQNSAHSAYTVKQRIIDCGMINIMEGAGYAFDQLYYDDESIKGIDRQGVIFKKKSSSMI
jgi:hypothetical protein